jgi:CRP/FNR family cyclic AMP-dependent transcriptional regulator
MQTNLFDEIPLFATLSGDDRWQLARLVAVRDVPAREVLFWVGDAGGDDAEFFVIQRGRVQITCPDEAGREVTLAVLGPGDFFGEVSLLDGGPRTATARVQDDATLLTLNRRAFVDFLRTYPSVAIHLLEVLGRRERGSVDKLRGIRNLNEVIEERLTRWERIANATASMAASRGFLVTHATAMIGWIILNLALRGRAPDPFPFPFLCFWSSTEAIFLSLFILISQNLQSQKDRLRTELEYQVALKAQFEIMQLHRKVDEMPGRLLEQLKGTETSDDTTRTSAHSAP